MLFYRNCKLQGCASNAQLLSTQSFGLEYGGRAASCRLPHRVKLGNVVCFVKNNGALNALLYIRALGALGRASYGRSVRRTFSREDRALGVYKMAPFLLTKRRKDMERYLMCKQNRYYWSENPFGFFSTGYTESELRICAERGDEWAARVVYESDLEEAYLSEFELA